MAIFRCLSLLRVWKKEKKVGKESPASAELNKGLKTLNLRLEHPVKPLESNGFKTASFRLSVPVDVEKNLLEVKVMNHGSLNVDEGAEIAYEGEDEHEENASLKRELSDFDFSRHGATTEEGECTRVSEELGDFDSSDPNMFCQFATNPGKDTEGLDAMQGGHISDPGIGRANFWGSPMLKRSCSNLETGRVQRSLADRLPNLKSQNSGYLNIPERSRDLGSPASFTSHQSADRVILKRHSSLQVLPSRSRRLWWKLFLWSHRNLHKPCTVKPKQETVSILVNQQGGYYSDTLEPNQATTSSTMQSPSSINGESLNLGNNDSKCNDKNWDSPHLGMSEMWPQNQWVAFSGESYPFARVDEWVRDLETEPPPIDSLDNIDDQKGKGIFFPPSPERSSVLAHRPDINLSEEILHANAMIRSLNSSSTIAHIFGIGLRAVPSLSCFSSLRSVNLSSNFIANIAPGTLPKGLHTLNLSRNKISTIEGLRELTRLRLLDLSYNRISRIGQGLSNCTIIKELYLAGNKISDVEGLHRLLKLTVLDLSFNKISTTKALGQLVANYNTLQALNLLGNPVLSNISEDQLRKAVCSLLPKLVYLSKQPIKPQRAREVLTDSVAKAALGSSGSWGSRQRASKKVSSMVTTSSVRDSGSSTMHKSKYGSKSRTGNIKAGSPARASSSRQNVPPFGTQL